VFLQKVYNMNNKSVSPSQNFAAEVTKLGAGDEIRRFDVSVLYFDHIVVASMLYFSILKILTDIFFYNLLCYFYHFL